MATLSEPEVFVGRDYGAHELDITPELVRHYAEATGNYDQAIARAQDTISAARAAGESGLESEEERAAGCYRRGCGAVKAGGRFLR